VRRASFLLAAAGVIAASAVVLARPAAMAGPMPAPVTQAVPTLPANPILPIAQKTIAPHGKIGARAPTRKTIAPHGRIAQQPAGLQIRCCLRKEIKRDSQGRFRFFYCAEFGSCPARR